MKALMLGDVYAKPGRMAIVNHLKNLIQKYNVDLVIVNGENTTHGKSLSLEHYNFLKKHHVDVITSGNNIFKNPEPLEYIDKHDDLLKPYNMLTTPGKGYKIVQKNGLKVCVLNLMGNVYMDLCHNVYDKMEEFLSLNLKYDVLLVDFHAEATAEKIAFALNYDGVITALVGTHTHVQTADERILPKGTAFITDLGMCGFTDSAIGSDYNNVVSRAKTGLIKQLNPAKGDGELNGVLIEIDTNTKKATSIKRIHIK